MELDKTRPVILTGDEPITSGGKPAGFTVLDFWRFQHSNVWDAQEEIAEFIVAKALGQDLPCNKNGWTLWDIDYRGRRIEVKESGYYHSWRTDGKVSPVRTFGITKAYTDYKDSSSAFERQNDAYVFCLNTGFTKEESDPLELDHWRFWVVPTATINRHCGDNRSISLGRIRTITGLKDGVPYCGLKAAVDAALDGPGQ